MGTSLSTGSSVIFLSALLFLSGPIFAVGSSVGDSGGPFSSTIGSAGPDSLHGVELQETHSSHEALASELQVLLASRPKATDSVRPFSGLGPALGRAELDRGRAAPSPAGSALGANGPTTHYSIDFEMNNEFGPSQPFNYTVQVVPLTHNGSNLSLVEIDSPLVTESVGATSGLEPNGSYGWEISDSDLPAGFAFLPESGHIIVSGLPLTVTVDLVPVDGGAFTADSDVQMGDTSYFNATPDGGAAPFFSGWGAVGYILNPDNTTTPCLEGSGLVYPPISEGNGTYIAPEWPLDLSVNSPEASLDCPGVGVLVPGFTSAATLDGAPLATLGNGSLAHVGLAGGFVYGVAAGEAGCLCGLTGSSVVAHVQDSQPDVSIEAEVDPLEGFDSTGNACPCSLSLVGVTYPTGAPYDYFGYANAPYPAVSGAVPSGWMFPSLGSEEEELAAAPEVTFYLATPEATLALPPGYYSAQFVAAAGAPLNASEVMQGVGLAGSVFSLVVGEDVGPVPYAVTFNESGLPPGITWYVNVTQGPRVSGVTSALSTGLPDGTYDFTVASGNKSYSAAAGSFQVIGGPIRVPIRFSLETFPVTFSDPGLPSGDRWMVELGGSVETTTTASVTLQASNGSHPYLIEGPSGYDVSGYAPGGTLTVHGPAGTQVLSFQKGRTYTLAVLERGLPKSGGSTQRWCIDLSGLRTCSTSASLDLANLTGTTYRYSVVQPVAGQSISVSVGKLREGQFGSVQLTSNLKVRVDFAYWYAVSFVESGLASGLWSVTLRGETHSASAGTPITFSVGNGTYAYKIGPVSGMRGHGTPKRIVVAGANAGVSVTFSSKRR